jgi:hypothetical protein
MTKKNKNTGLLLLLLLIPVGFYVKSRILKRIRKAKRKKAEIIIPPLQNINYGLEYIVNLPSGKLANIRDKADMTGNIVGKFKGGLRFGGGAANADWIQILSAPDPKINGMFIASKLVKATGKDFTGK